MAIRSNARSFGSSGSRTISPREWRERLPPFAPDSCDGSMHRARRTSRSSHASYAARVAAKAAKAAGQYWGGRRKYPWPFLSWLLVGWLVIKNGEHKIVRPIVQPSMDTSRAAPRRKEGVRAIPSGSLRARWCLLSWGGGVGSRNRMSLPVRGRRRRRLPIQPLLLYGETTYL